MRKQFNGLWALAGEKLKMAENRSRIAFCNKDRDRVKMLGRDGGVGDGEAAREGPVQLAGGQRPREAGSDS